VTDPIEREDTDHGVAAPMTDRPREAHADTGHPADVNEPTGAGTSIDPEATVNLTGDLDSTVNLSGGEVIFNERDDAAATNEVTRALAFTV